MEEESKDSYEYKPPRAYVQRIKRHQDAIIALHSPHGIEGTELVSGSADEQLRIWNMADHKVSKPIDVTRPTDDQLIKYRNMGDHSLPMFSDMVKLENQAQESNASIQKKKINPLMGLLPRKTSDIPTMMICAGPLCLLGYEDGLITLWDMGNGNFLFPMIGHTNRVNHMLADEKEEFIYSSANDCTVRQWDISTGVCENVFKFADPISVTKIRSDFNFLFTASWDKMIRVVDLGKQLVLKSFVASKETIKEMVITKDLIIVAGCEPIIRAYNLETGKSKTFMGHKGWVYCLMAHQHMLFSGGDDNTVRVWDLNTTHQLECLTAHRNGVTAIALCNGDLYTASFDHYLMHWDLPALMARLEEMAMMRKEDVLSRKVEAYYRIVAEKNKKKAKDTKKRR